MERYFLILFFSVFGLIYSDTEVYDIFISEEYNITNYGDISYFRMAVESNSDMIIKLKVPKVPESQFNIGISGFFYYPINEEVISSYDRMTLLKDFTKSSNSEYDEYIFPFSTLKYSYISIYLNISSQINFCQFLYMNPQK